MQYATAQRDGGDTVASRLMTGEGGKALRQRVMKGKRPLGGGGPPG